MRGLQTITIARRFHGPSGSGNGGYVCGRLAAFINGTARVRLYVPPPLEVPLEVRRGLNSVALAYEGVTIAEAWPAELDLEMPTPPSCDDAAAASKHFAGFRSHRFPTCFVCGIDRPPEDGLHIFAGPVPGRGILACTWIPQEEFTGADGAISPEFVWCVLDCPGGFAFPEPKNATILLGELTAVRYASVRPLQTYVVTAWEISSDGRKHHTGTALSSSDGRPVAMGRAIWLEVPPDTVE